MSSPITAGRVFLNRPDRVANAWRRLCFTPPHPRPDEVPSLLEDVAEPFIREVGASLEGTPGSAWSRTRGVLRVSRERGARGLYDEFSLLRRCLITSLETLGASSEERECVEKSVDEAVQSAVALQRHLDQPEAVMPTPAFGGIVLEMFEESVLHPEPAQP